MPILLHKPYFVKLSTNGEENKMSKTVHMVYGCPQTYNIRHILNSWLSINTPGKIDTCYRINMRIYKILGNYLDRSASDTNLFR